MIFGQSYDPNAEYTTCPRCGRDTLRTDRPALNALSRTDNETYVCSECGTDEALDNFQNGPSKAMTQKDWANPPTTS